jgi:hypothetical protein
MFTKVEIQLFWKAQILSSGSRYVWVLRKKKIFESLPITAMLNFEPSKLWLNRLWHFFIILDWISIWNANYNNYNISIPST